MTLQQTRTALVTVRKIIANLVNSTNREIVVIKKSSDATRYPYYISTQYLNLNRYLQYCSHYFPVSPKTSIKLLIITLSLCRSFINHVIRTINKAFFHWLHTSFCNHLKNLIY